MSLFLWVAGCSEPPKGYPLFQVTINVGADAPPGERAAVAVLPDGSGSFSRYRLSELQPVVHADSFVLSHHDMGVLWEAVERARFFELPEVIEAETNWSHGPTAWVSVETTTQSHHVLLRHGSSAPLQELIGMTNSLMPEGAVLRYEPLVRPWWVDWWQRLVAPLAPQAV